MKTQGEMEINFDNDTLASHHMASIDYSKDYRYLQVSWSW